MMMCKCCSVSKNLIDKNNESESRSWIVFRHGNVVKFTSAAEFSLLQMDDTKVTTSELRILNTRVMMS